MNIAFLKTIPIAHRGLHEHAPQAGLPVVPENSLAAFGAGLARGFALEMDVALSRDGAVMVFHDDGLERLCGNSRALPHVDAAELERTPLLGTGETIPTLAHVLAFAAGRVPLIIELKSFDSCTGFHEDGALEDACLALLAWYRGPFAFKSFNPFTVNRLLAAREDGRLDAPVGFLACDYARDADFSKLPREIWSAHQAISSDVASRAQFVSYAIDDLTAEISARARGRGQPLMVWTIRTEAQYEKARALADNVVFEWRGVSAPGEA